MLVSPIKMVDNTEKCILYSKTPSVTFTGNF